MTSSKEVREIAMKIIKAEIFMVNLEPKVKRVDAIQSFISQETPIVRLTTQSGLVGEDIPTPSARAALPLLPCLKIISYPG